MPQKPANQDLSQSTTGIVNNTQLETIYEKQMDTMLSAVGRDVKFYLEPIRTATSSNPEHYDPFSGGQDRRLGNANTGDKGYTVEPVWVIYKAHIMHGPREVRDERTGDMFRLKEGEVRLTTVYGAWSDIQEAIEVEIDGLKFSKMDKTPRPFGWSTPKYILSYWTRKVENA